jgi:plasmid stabilization system protein ParE
MARRVKWTEIAWNDLEESTDYIAKDSPFYAAAFIREVRDAARSLAYMAKRGRIVPELYDPNIREFFVRSYRMVYRVTDDSVYIIAFIHGARDLSKLLEQKKRL